MAARFANCAGSLLAFAACGSVVSLIPAFAYALELRQMRMSDFFRFCNSEIPKFRAA